MWSSTLSFLLILCFVGTIAEICDDCIDYTSCKRAKELALTDKSDETKYLFRTAYCGKGKCESNSECIIKVCCSQFYVNSDEVPSFEQRLSASTMQVDNPNDGKGKHKDDDKVHPNLRLLPTSCGDLYKDRIVGGIVASLYEFPWMALISYPVDNGVSFQCSGSLINSRYVLTAAHCVANKAIKGVRIGEFDIRYEEDCQKGHCERNVQDMLVQEKIVHESYGGYPYFANDIALLRLEHHVDLTQQNADPICLPVSKALREGSITHMLGTVAGWGIMENDTEAAQLLKVLIPVHDNNACQDYYSQVPDVGNNRFCAGILKKDSCRGDSGGPLMIEAQYRGSIKFVQFGIISTGPQRCGTQTPGLYTDVRKYMDWILDKLKE